MLSIDRDWQRPVPTRAELRTDVIVAVVVALVSMASVSIYRSASATKAPDHVVEAYLWFALAGLALAGRRRFPLTTMLVEAVVFIVVGERMEDLGVIFTIQMTMFAAIYAAWAWSRHPARLVASSVLVVVAMFAWLAWSFTKPGALPGGPSYDLLPRDAALVLYALVINVVYFFGAIAWGHAAWMSARRRSVIEAQLERERDQQRAERSRAVQAERVRIARDLHDVVAHHVSSIGIQATGARRVLATDPEAAAGALGTIESSSRQAVSQMHQLVGLLRAGDEPADGVRPPQPGLDDLARLADDATVPAVEVHEVGERADVPATVALTLFRVAQEALTNARRHAAARHVTVTLRHLEDEVELEVIDDGRGSAASAPARDDAEGEGGYGLSGIRERVAMLDGTTDIGDRPQGGFRVRVRLPRDRTTDQGDA
ncbi:MAG: sensor histidine kinase [Aeromicrobium erythreum]